MEKVQPFELSQAVQGLLAASSVEVVDRNCPNFAGLDDLAFLQKLMKATSQDQVKEASAIMQEHKAEWLRAAKRPTSLQPYACTALRQFALLVPHQIQYSENIATLLPSVLKLVDERETTNAANRQNQSNQKLRDPTAFKAKEAKRNKEGKAKRKAKDYELWKQKKREENHRRTARKQAEREQLKKAAQEMFEDEDEDENEDDETYGDGGEEMEEEEEDEVEVEEGEEAQFEEQALEDQQDGQPVESTWGDSLMEETGSDPLPASQGDQAAQIIADVAAAITANLKVQKEAREREAQIAAKQQRKQERAEKRQRRAEKRESKRVAALNKELERSAEGSVVSSLRVPKGFFYESGGGDGMFGFFGEEVEALLVDEDTDDEDFTRYAGKDKSH